MVNKPFLLLGLAAEYRSRCRRRWCDKHCGRPSAVYDTDWRTKLTALETISRWLIQKTKKSLFEPPFRALRGNVCTPSMAHWKARGRLYIRHNWTCFTISYGWDVMSENPPKSAFFEGGWVTLNADFGGKGASPSNHCWYQSSRVIALSCGIKISAVRHLVLSQSTRVTDGQTDRQTDRQMDRITTPKTALAYARAVKIKCAHFHSTYRIKKREIPCEVASKCNQQFSNYMYKQFSVKVKG